MKFRWSLVVVEALVSFVVVLAICSAQGQSGLDKPGTKAGDTATGPDGGVYVWVPPGEFMMGSPEGVGSPAEHPAHRVRITKGFWLGKCTVTLGQWTAYCHKVGVKLEATAPGDNYPAINVSWNEVAAYCRTYGLALPTEAQWEYAARGPEGRKYPWGNQWDPKRCNNLDSQAPGGTTFPVGSFPDGASWCGALDMAGNVWEWCE